MLLIPVGLIVFILVFYPEFFDPIYRKKSKLFSPGEFFAPKSKTIYHHYICKDCPENDGYSFALMNQKKDAYDSGKGSCPYCDNTLKYQGSTYKKLRV